MMSYLSFHHEFEFYESSIFIITVTKAALINDSFKTITKFTKQRMKKIAISKFIDQQLISQSIVFKNSAVQPNEDSNDNSNNTSSSLSKKSKNNNFRDNLNSI